MIPRQHEPGDRPTMAGSFDGLYTLAHAHSLAFTVFLRTDFGKEGIGLGGLAAGLLILGYGSFTNCYAMFVYFLAWVGALACQRVKQFKNWRAGVAIHSRYNGFPWLARRLFPRMSESNLRGADAFLCLAAGGLLGQFSPPLGLFVATGFASILLVEAVMVESTRKRLQAMRDAEIEQRYLAERYKSGRF